MAKHKHMHKRGAKMRTRLMITAAFVLLQILVFMAMAYLFAGRKQWVYIIFQVISFLTVARIVTKKANPSYKLMWIIFILLFPIVGGLSYLVWGGGRIFPHVKKRMRKFSEGAEPFLEQDPKVKNRLCYDDLHHSRQSTYLEKASGFPVYDNTECVYLSPGERALPVILRELEKAEKYIFIEFFILSEDSMWEPIHKILKEKVKKGVDVRVIFDDFGSITRQYKGFAKRLREEGIKVSVFNKISASVNIFQNNRNHRKIIVIDGKVAFTGGMNIADEYINAITLHGYWMDCAVMLKGKAVSSFVVMFLNMWGFCVGKKQRYAKYITDYVCPTAGFVQPYSDSPISDKNPGEGLYMQMLNTAQKYVYIATPYLIVDNAMTRALTLAAESGVDVRIITPHIPDKGYVHPVTQFSYEDLLEAGVKIYEYTPGFIHSKFFVSDDRVATVGTINMDYRSFFFHFECGVWMCGNDAVMDIKNHFLELQRQSQKIERKKWQKRPLRQKLKQAILYFFAPFM
ncbi:MAG: cardiolipin synthase [Clostridia bacterium]|nr:cardiolipin synthase [Clostridia bacterium]